MVRKMAFYRFTPLPQPKISPGRKNLRKAAAETTKPPPCRIPFPIPIGPAYLPSMLPPDDELEIAPAELAALRDDPAAPSIRLIDCREEDEFALCRIEGAELIPLSRFAEMAPARLLRSDDPRPLVVYCHHGMRSMHATIFLRERGRKEVWSLAGGIDLWSRAVDPGVIRY